MLKAGLDWSSLVHTLGSRFFNILCVAFRRKVELSDSGARQKAFKVCFFDNQSNGHKARHAAYCSALVTSSEKSKVIGMRLMATAERFGGGARQTYIVIVSLA